MSVFWINVALIFIIAFLWVLGSILIALQMDPRYWSIPARISVCVLGVAAAYWRVSHASWAIAHEQYTFTYLDTASALESNILFMAAALGLVIFLIIGAANRRGRGRQP